MKRVPVRSSNVAEVGWENDTMEVKFTSGAVYQFSGVPSAVHRQMVGASSIGKFFASEIRGKFITTKIS